MASIPFANDRYIAVTVHMAALGTAKSSYVACPVNGTIRMILGCLEVTVDGNNAITTEINNVAVTGGGFTFLSSGSAAGQVMSAAPTAANTVRRGDTLEVITDGGGSTGDANFTFLIEQDI